MPASVSGDRVGLLRRASDLRSLYLATLASSIGTWLAFVALVVDVYDRTASAGWVSALLLAEFLPLVLIGLVVAPLLDRLPRRRVLIGADIVRAVVFCALPFATTALQVVLFALAAGVATSLFRPAVYAGLPNLVDDDDLPRANGLLQSAENVTLAVGPVLGGLLVSWAGPGPAYWFNAASFLLSAVLILRIRRTLEVGAGESPGHWREVVDGLALLRSSPSVRAVVVVWSIVMIASAAVSVAEIVLAKEVFGAGDTGYGLMVSAMGVGLVLGGLWASGRVRRHGVRAAYVVAVAVMAAGIGAAAAAPSVWVAAAMLVLAGAGNGAALVCNAVLIQRGVADRLRGRAFTLAMSVSYGALGLGMVAAGPLTGAVGPRALWGAAAGLLLVAAATALRLTRELGPVTRVAAEQAVELRGA
ncbi:MAG: MFS transporter [Thermoleophilia bacterium]|nr:MFS transporter [Thermoleophilia bacterium]